ncbi:MAG: GPR endopeptidase [Clostridia bacterium]|nr:GPR endopeptidase [Clostridia bacterium]
MGIRTDLALEAKELYNESTKDTGDIDGVIVKTDKAKGVMTTKITITNENGSKALTKPIGTYVTIEAPDIKYSTEVYENACKLLAEEIRNMTKISPDTKTLVVGLGNKSITPDALGPDVVSKLMVTNHVKEHMKDFFGDNLTSVCAIAPGVLGTTGMETAQIIKGVTEQVHPDLIICVDALASRSLDRISTTIQLSDTGINPGAGVDNNREGLNEKTLGVKVIAIGVPTVVDAHTIVSDSIDMAFNDIKEEIPADGEKNRLIKEALTKNIKKLMVTPKDIDSVIEKTSKTVANGINLALHKNLTFEDIESFVG